MKEQDHLVSSVVRLFELVWPIIRSVSTSAKASTVIQLRTAGLFTHSVGHQGSRSYRPPERYLHDHLNGDQVGQAYHIL